MPDIRDPDLRVLLRKIHSRTGIDLSQYKDNYISRRLLTRLRSNGVNSYREYIKVLDERPEEYDKAIDAFTINVSEFFRDKETYRAIREQVIPAIIAEKNRFGRRMIRIWSAGCAGGEEIYSISIILNEVLGDDYDRFTISLYATDIDDACMNRAKEGIYDRLLLRNVDKPLIEKYFINMENGKLAVKDRVKRNIHYKHFDLISGEKFGSYFDMILCRNVMIYFSDEQKRKLLMELYNSLSSGGYLVIGKTETLVGESRNLFEVVNNLERIYRRPG